MIREDRLNLFRLLVVRRLRVARRKGEITEHDYIRALATLGRDDATQEVYARSVPAAGIDWQRISEWLKNNWLEVLKIVLTVAVLFLDSGESEPYTSGGDDHADA